MKKVTITYSLMFLVFFLASASFAGIFMDGDDADWAEVPYAVENWVDGVEGLYPEEVGAIVTDNVDIKSVKATMMGNTLFWYMQMHAGPAWPNKADQGEYEGVPINRSRGYYHVLLDLDNNIETGWKTDWYESHYTTVGFLASQGQPDMNPIGAELWVEWGGKYFKTAPHPDSGGIKNSGVDGLNMWLDDWSEYDGVSDNELTFGIAEYEVTDPDSAKGMMWQGALRNLGGSNDDLNNDSLRSHYFGYAWGEDFLECGIEMTHVMEYFKAKSGADYFKPGDIIGICGFNETPADGWGVDITTRGEFTCPGASMRPTSMTFDRDDSDWADVPFAVQDWVDGVEGLYPEEVGAIVTDNVDIKEVKAVVNVEEEALYWFLRMHGGPAMPNTADQGEYEGVPINRSRGYYHVLLDLDNDIETGWKTDWYESHYTTVGFLASQGQPNMNPIGAEVWSELGMKYYKTAPHPDSGGIKNSGVDGLNLWLDDWSEYDGVSDNELTFGIAEYEVTDPDSAKALQHDGMYPNLGGSDETIVHGKPDFFAYSWGYDFVEVGHSYVPIKEYFMNKTGQEFFKPGDVIGICGFNETPADGWGVDITTRGEFIVAGGTAVNGDVALVEEYSLSNNYPNPFNPTTSINYSIPAATDVSIIIFNTLGQSVRTLVDKSAQAGKHVVNWDGTNNAGLALSTGVYYYTIKADEFSETKKMMLIK
jgi:hypothetical protein